MTSLRSDGTHAQTLVAVPRLDQRFHLFENALLASIVNVALTLGSVDIQPLCVGSAMRSWSPRRAQHRLAPRPSVSCRGVVQDVKGVALQLKEVAQHRVRDTRTPVDRLAEVHDAPDGNVLELHLATHDARRGHHPLQ